MPPLLHITVLLVSAMLAFGGSTSLAQQEQPFGVDLVESFELIALRNEYGGDDWVPVRKWTEPLRVYLDSRVGYKDLQHEMVDTHLNQLVEITKHDIRITADKSEANTLLVFDAEQNLRSLADTLIPDAKLDDQFLNRSVCLATIYLNSDSSIKKAVVIIPVDRARAKAKLLTCIIEELTQILGLVNDSDKVYPSIFNDKSIDQKLSYHDVHLLKLLYHPEVRPGMSRTEVMPTIKRLAESIP